MLIINNNKIYVRESLENEQSKLKRNYLCEENDTETQF